MRRERAPGRLARRTFFVLENKVLDRVSWSVEVVAERCFEQTNLRVSVIGDGQE